MLARFEPSPKRSYMVGILKKLSNQSCRSCVAVPWSLSAVSASTHTVIAATPLALPLPQNKRKWPGSLFVSSIAPQQRKEMVLPLPRA